MYGVDDATNAANLTLFSNIINNAYWTGTETSSGSTSAFYFGAGSGVQGTSAKSGGNYVWAVASGDVGASAIPVPVPAAAWLLGSALLGLTGWRRLKN